VITSLDDVLAHAQIRELAHRYSLALDSRDMDMLVDLFVEDVRTGDEVGRDALRRSFDGMMREVGITILNVGTHVIERDGPDEARGWVYAWGQIQDGDRWIIQSILYTDRYVRRTGPSGDRWYFARHRRHRLWYGAEVGVNPLTLPPANWPEHHDGMGDVPAAAFPTWARYWEGQA
jgi:hypothetical protein